MNKLEQSQTQESSKSSISLRNKIVASVAGVAMAGAAFMGLKGDKTETASQTVSLEQVEDATSTTNESAQPADPVRLSSPEAPADTTPSSTIVNVEQPEPPAPSVVEAKSTFDYEAQKNALTNHFVGQELAVYDTTLIIPAGVTIYNGPSGSETSRVSDAPSSDVMRPMLATAENGDAYLCWNNDATPLSCALVSDLNNADTQALLPVEGSNQEFAFQRFDSNKLPAIDVVVDNADKNQAFDNELGMIGYEMTEQQDIVIDENELVVD